MTPRVYKEILDGIDLKWFNYIQKQLLRGTYKLKHIGRVNMPNKKGSKQTSPLGVCCARDKVVQKALQ